MWRKARFMKTLPSESEIHRNLQRCGFRKIQINKNQIKFSQAGMRLDLGAIAKGYAADEAMKILKEYVCGKLAHVRNAALLIRPSFLFLMMREVVIYANR